MGCGVVKRPVVWQCSQKIKKGKAADSTPPPKFYYLYLLLVCDFVRKDALIFYSNLSFPLALKSCNQF